MEQGQQIVSEIGKIVTSTFKNKPVFGEPEKESLRNIIRSTKTDDCQSLRDLLFSVAEEYENRTGMKAAAWQGHNYIFYKGHPKTFMVEDGPSYLEV